MPGPLTLRGMIAAEQGNIRRLAMALPPSNMRAHMDINMEYAAHQRAVMCAASATSTGERTEHLTRASTIAGKISVFQRELGAAAACAWSLAQVSALRRGLTGKP